VPEYNPEDALGYGEFVHLVYTSVITHGFFSFSPSAGDRKLISYAVKVSMSAPILFYMTNVPHKLRQACLHFSLI